MKVQVTVVVTPDHGISRVESTTLRFDEAVQPIEPKSDTVANAARLVAQRAIYGDLLPPPKREGGNG